MHLAVGCAVHPWHDRVGGRSLLTLALSQPRVSWFVCSLHLFIASRLSFDFGPRLVFNKLYIRDVSKGGKAVWTVFTRHLFIQCGREGEKTLLLPSDA